MSFTITGTHIWYYFICHRQVWLISHKIEPDQEHEALLLGRINDQTGYSRKKKYLYFEGGVVDLYREQHGQLIISEVKKSSRFEESARMQLLYYLFKLQEVGIDAIGELRIPKEKKVMAVRLDSDSEIAIQKACAEIDRIVALDLPPAPCRCRYCRGCAYLEFCWS
ncbi:MAG: CRISPR-associated protein Cas4 [Chloroflexota bacterium]|nr:CRISPR-associated protein Cas4 [Chloroflexota bacterium]